MGESNINSFNKLTIGAEFGCTGRTEAGAGYRVIPSAVVGRISFIYRQYGASLVDVGEQGSGTVGAGSVRRTRAQSKFDRKKDVVRVAGAELLARFW